MVARTKFLANGYIPLQEKEIKKAKKTADK